MIRTGIIGATGYAGAELVKILSKHEKTELSVITSRKYAGVDFAEVYPAMTGIVDMKCEEYSEDIHKKADIFFLALPHKLPMEIAPKLIADGKKTIDLSADFRFSDVDKYEAYYQPHKAKELLKQAVYGLSEVYANEIKKAALIGNPGCYPTSVLLPLIPLIKNNFVNTDTIIIDSKSGASGAGRSLSVASHYCEVNESFKAYKVASHRHSPEIEEILEKEAKKSVKMTFTPHLIPISRGMATTIYADLKNDKISEDDITTALSSYYSGKYFIRVCKKRIPDTLAVTGTNFCDIGARIDKKNGRLILLSAIDNLVKGAAGQAVQNMNIMLGIDETTGLNL